MFNAKCTIIQLYHGEVIYPVDGVDARFVLNRLSWNFIALAYWRNSPWVDMSHILTSHY